MYVSQIMLYYDKYSWGFWLLWDIHIREVVEKKYFTYLLKSTMSGFQTLSGGNLSTLIPP